MAARRGVGGRALAVVVVGRTVVVRVVVVPTTAVSTVRVGGAGVMSAGPACFGRDLPPPFGFDHLVVDGWMVRARREIVRNAPVVVVVARSLGRVRTPRGRVRVSLCGWGRGGGREMGGGR